MPNWSTHLTALMTKAVEHPTTDEHLALVLSGGGARAAYQVGVLLAIGERFPELRIRILTGVSAGAINTSLMRIIYALKSGWQIKRASLDESGKREYWQAGKSVAGIRSVEPAEDIVRRFAAAARSVGK